MTGRRIFVSVDDQTRPASSAATAGGRTGGYGEGNRLTTVIGPRLHQYSPKRTREGPATVVEYHNIAIDHVTMLTADHQLEQAITVQGLGQYLTDACQIIDDELDGVVHSYDSMIVHFRLAPDTRPNVSLALGPDDRSPWRPELVDRLITRLLDLRSPAVARFEVRFEVWLNFPK